MNITLTTEDLADVRDEGTVVVVTGTGPDGDRITFGADRHVFIVACGGLLDGSGEITVQVAGWQILHREPAQASSVAHSAGTER